MKMELDEFYETITDWLLPLGYVEVFKNNELQRPCRIDFQKEGVRVVCILDVGFPSCYLHMDILLPEAISIRTMNYSICTPKLNELHNYLIKNSKLLY